MILSSGDVFLCAEVTEMLCLDGRENGHHLSSGGLEWLTSAGWKKAGCSPQDRDCLVGPGSWEWDNDGVLPPVLYLRNLYVLLSFPFLFVLALHWCCFLQLFPNSISFFAVIAEKDFPEKELRWLIYMWCEISERATCKSGSWILTLFMMLEIHSLCAMSQAKVHWDLDQSCSVVLFSHTKLQRPWCSWSGESSWCFKMLRWSEIILPLSSPNTSQKKKLLS